MYMLLAVAAADIIRLVLFHVFSLRETLAAPAVHRAVGLVCAAALAAVTLGGAANAHNVRVTPYDITVGKSAGEMSEMKIVLAADLHLGYNVGLAQVRRMVEKINEQDADLVVIAGDIFDNEWEAVKDPDGISAELRRIRSRYGVYAVYGNHDVEEPVLAGFTFGGGDGKSSCPEMDAFLEESGITLLRDEGVLINGAVWLYGRPDARRPGRGIDERKTPQEIMSGLDASKPVIILDHEPSQLGELAAAGADIALGGHTHDGQLFPGNIAVGLLWENPYGYLNKDGMHSIVTSGVGLFGPDMRVGTVAEICPITVHFGGGSST